MEHPAARRLEASFRDPNGFLFTSAGILYRQVNRAYAEHYERLMESGLYTALVAAGRLVPHEEVDLALAEAPELAWKVLQPERLSFISYPYEWGFSQLKDAALLTLQVQKQAIQHGLTLKDASAYNVQFHRGRPVLIDTLSFEVYLEGRPWIAYRQFCQHFLAPLSLMAHRDARLEQLMRVFIDGVPLDLASRLLPLRTRLSLPLLLHLHLHATSQKRYAGQAVQQAGGSVSKTQMLGLVDSLETGVQSLRWSPAGTAWGDYYDEHNYSNAGQEHKAKLVGEFLEQIRPASVWDLGANTGRFSRLASERGIPTVAFDVDPGAVEKNYLESRQRSDENLLPLLLDLTNPSPALGWHNRERASLLERSPAGAVLALALVHHLAIANNVPLDRLAAFFQALSPWLIVEFVPKEDSQVKRLLASREDIFPDYTTAGFEQAFSRYYTIHRAEAIRDSARRLYLMESRPE